PSSRPLTRETAQETILTEVGDLCRLYQSAKGKPPDKTADLAPFRTVAASGYAALKSGEVVLRYGAALSSTAEEPGQGPDGEVLAYFADVPRGGGRVLLLNRAVRTMTAEEFKAAPKAGKEPSVLTKAKKTR